jgi:5'-methylthioadenosine phosphorylase
LEKARIAIIGGTGFEDLFKGAEQTRLETPYGTVPSLFVRNIENRNVILLPRHGPDHSVPPHRVNYRANICALHKMGVERIVATNAVGAINRDFKPGDIVVPNDFIDFTKLRAATFYDDAPVTHIDVSNAYCPEIRKLLIETAKKRDLHVWDKAVLVCTEGPRFETPAETEMFRRLGCDVVGMTGFPEVVLARELEMCYASICYVSNMAAGIQQRLTAFEVSEISKQILPEIEEVLIESVRGLHHKRGDNCTCASALQDARFK